MQDGVKFFGSMFAWVAFCALLVGSLNRSLSREALLLAGLIMFAGTLWIPAVMTKGVHQANILIGYTVAVLVGMAAIAYVIVLLLGF